MKKFTVILLSMLFIVSMSAVLTGCKKDEHIHVFDKQVASENYFAKEATCLEKAKYYYSCSCGEKGTETFESGEALGHSFTEYIYDFNISCTQDGTLSATCERCGAKDTVTLTGTKLDHKYENGKCIYCGRKHLSEGLAYTLITDEFGDYYEVSGIGVCTEKDISIPETYNNLPVKSIGQEAFRDCGSLVAITIPNNITSIGDYAFLDCTRLERITFPSGITSIGYSAFINCFGLKRVNYLGTVDQWAEIIFKVDISEGASFTNPLSITNDLYINDNLVTEIELTTAVKVASHAFAYCNSLTKVTIGDNITAIGDGAFAFCNSLTSVIIPETITSIGDKAFAECRNLTNITLPNAITAISNGIFYHCSSLTSVTIPNNVVTIGDDAFNGCIGLTNITIPTSVTTIGNGAFV